MYVYLDCILQNLKTAAATCCQSCIVLQTGGLFFIISYLTPFLEE